MVSQCAQIKEGQLERMGLKLRNKVTLTLINDTIMLLHQICKLMDQTYKWHWNQRSYNIYVNLYPKYRNKFLQVLNKP